MAWLTENWFWILTFIAFVAMHLFGHGHGGHGGHRGHGGDKDRRSSDGSDATQSGAAKTGSGGRHH